MPKNGTFSKLEALENNDCILLKTTEGKIELIDDMSARVYDPIRFKLTTPDGIEFIINKKSGGREHY